jgi:proteasome accessory factor B
VYRLGSGYRLPPAELTIGEALAVSVLCHELGGRQLPFLSPARTAAVKLESSFPAEVRKQLRRVADAIQIQFPPSNRLEGQATVYQQLLDAIADRRSPRIEYASLFDQKTIRTRLCPYRLLFSRHCWYVIGRSTIHRSVRTFNVGRIVRIEATDEFYKIPHNFSLERYLGNAWSLIPEPGPNYQVRIQFSKQVAKNVEEVKWHKTQRCRWNDDGSLEFFATVKGLNEISWWILGYGDQAEVHKPPKLRRLIAERSRRAAQQYVKG